MGPTIETEDDDLDVNPGSQNPTPPANPPATPPLNPLPTPPVSAEPPTEPKEPPVVQMPSTAIRALRNEAREKGRKAAEDANLARLKALGYESWEALEEAQKKPAQTPEPATPPKAREPQARTPKEPTMGATADQKLKRDNERLVEEKKRLARQRAATERRLKQTERERDALAAEHALKLAATKAGVSDVDYAVTLLKRQLSGKSTEELAAFDEGKFFAEDLRKSHPYLFGVESTLADTGPNTREEQGGGGPQKPGTKERDSAPIDPRKMTVEQYEATLAKHGLTNPAVGTPV
jgi:hypothetical protein